MNINLKTALFEVIIFFVSSLLVYQLTDLNQELQDKIESRFKMMEAADKLRQSSDDLTHFARSYVVTKNKIFKEQYFKTLDIRNGKIPRPLHYESIYWDLEESVRLARHPLTKSKSLKSILQNLPFSSSEMQLLDVSETNSNELVNLEVRAFKAIENSKQAEAIKLLHSPQYYHEKHRIMNPIDKFIILSGKRTSLEIQVLTDKIEKVYFMMLFISLLFILGNMLLFRELRKKDKILLESLQESKRELTKSIAVYGQHVIASSTDSLGIITNVTESFCDISGYTKEELIGKPHNIIRHKNMSSELFEELWNTIRSGKQWNGKIKNRAKDGSVYWVDTSIMAIKDKDNKIIGYESIRHDITAQKVKEEFMANMSHELRTPLNSILGFSTILMRKQENPKEKELSRQINLSAKSLLNLINDILDLSKIHDSKFSISPFEFNAYENIEEFSHQFEGLTAQKSLSFTNTIDKSLQAIFFADISRINQITLNLISNAVKFTPENGEIKFSTSYKNNKLLIKVEDNGIGMSPSTADKVFKPFVQADGTTTRKYGGTGLGLSIVQSLVELMNGKIELISHEGKGTTITVTLPIEKREERKELISNKEEDSFDTKELLNSHILIAEDNRTNQMLLSMLLEEFGISCDIANDGVEAVEMYNPKLHSLILMDENMPNMNGLEAMKIIKEKYAEECGDIIAVTANVMAGDAARFLDLGMDGYISKPIDENELYKSLKKALNSKG